MHCVFCRPAEEIFSLGTVVRSRDFAFGLYEYSSGELGLVWSVGLGLGFGLIGAGTPSVSLEDPGRAEDERCCERCS
jgi:hypothetical protein